MKRRRIQGKYAPKYPTYWEHISPLILLVFTATVSATMWYARPNIADTQVQAEVVETIAGQTLPSPTPEPTPEPLTEKQQILAYIVEKFGDDAADAIVVIRKCENSSFNPRAVNHNRNGSVDRGIFQLNSQYWGGEELFDWKTNVDVAHKVFTRAGKKWTPWTCAHVVGQKNYLNQ